MLMSVRTILSLLTALACATAACAQPSNDNFANRIPVEPGIPFDASAFGSTFEPFDPLASLTIRPYGSVWWTWTPQVTGFASIIDTKNFQSGYFGFDAVAVFQSDDLATLRNPTWTYLSPLYDEPFGVKAFIGFPTTAGLPVSIGMVAGEWQNFTHNLLMTFSETPIIIEAPASQTNNAGGAVAFHFTSPSYRFGRTQWQFNGEDIPNATNAVLFLSDLRPSHAGEYRVIIDATNSAGVLKRTISPPATLTILGDVAPPTLSFQRAPDSPSDFVLNIFGTTNQWYAVDRTSDFATWAPVDIDLGWVNTVNTAKNGQLVPIPHLANSEFLRVQHRGNLTEVCVHNLRQIHFAKELFRFAYHGLPGQSINPDDLKQFIGELPKCPLKGTYTYNALDTPPTCSLIAYGHDAYAGVIWP
jgi:hypothetical protein